MSYWKTLSTHWPSKLSNISLVIAYINSFLFDTSLILYYALYIFSEKKPNKEQCGMCKMYFEKCSVSYKVPNHRIMDLQKKWKYKREGRRYNTASFIYASETVCVFCSQLFSNELDVDSRKGLPPAEQSLSPKAPMKEFESVAAVSPDRNMIQTETKRQDIALNQRVYQSSTVDNLDASIAVTPNETRYIRTGSKTRREVDAWWEVDFGRPQHVHALSITLATAIQISLKVRVMLLNCPLGFEDPFLDSVTKKAIVSKDFELESGKSMAEMTTIEWELPPSTICVAARVQLYGIHALFIQEFHAYQGNEVVDFTDADLQRTVNSYASLSPQKMNAGWLEISRSHTSGMLLPDPLSSRPGTKATKGGRRQNGMVTAASFNSLPGSPSALDGGHSAFSTGDFSMKFGSTGRLGGITKGSGGGSSSGRRGGKHSRDMVTRLSEQIKNQNDAIQSWKNRVLHSANYFSLEEILAMRDCIFNVMCAECGVQPVEAPIIAVAPPPRDSPPLSPMGKGEGFFLTEGSSATVASGGTGGTAEEHDHHHTSSMVVQEKPTISYGIFDHELLDQALVLYNPRGALYNLSKRLRQLLRWIQSRERAKEVGVLMYSDKFMALALDSADVLYKLSAAFKVVEGGAEGIKDCSWSQFLIIMHLTCIGKSSMIYKWAYPKSHFALDPVSELEGGGGGGEWGPRSSRNPSRERGAVGDGSMSASHVLSSGGSALFAEPSRCSTQGGQSVRSSTANKNKRDNYKSLTWNEITGCDNSRPGTSARSTFVALKMNQLANKLEHEYTFPKSLQEAVDMAERNAAVHGKRAALSTGAIKVATASKKEDAAVAASSSDADSLGGLDDMSLTASDDGGLMTGKLKQTLARPGTGAQGTAPGSALPLSAGLTPSPSAPVSFFAESNPFAGGGGTSGTNFGGASGRGHTGHASHTGHDDSLQGQSMDDLLKGFDKTCALCVRTFPKKALEMKVLFKHVIALRRSWDPALVPKVIEALDQSITMYNLVNVCSFCSQYFDPDFEGGIAFPQRNKKPAHPEGLIGKIVAEKHPLVEFLDDRHLNDIRGDESTGGGGGGAGGGGGGGGGLNGDSGGGRVGTGTRAATANRVTGRFKIADFPTCVENNLKSAAVGGGSEDSSLSGMDQQPQQHYYPGYSSNNSYSQSDKWFNGLINVASQDSQDGGDSLSGLSQLSVSSDAPGPEYLRSSNVSRSRARAKKAVEISKEMERQNAAAPAHDDD